MAVRRAITGPRVVTEDIRLSKNLIRERETLISRSAQKKRRA
jgi:hypothetical protein